MAQTARLNADYLESSPDTKDAIRGVPYFLPATVLPVTVAGDFQPIPTASKEEQKKAEFQDFVITVTLGQPKQIADPSAQFILEYLPKSTTSDEFRITVGDDGLLETVKLTSEDQSGEIAKKLAELAKEAAKAVVQFGTGAPVGFREQADEEANRLRCRELVQKFSVTKNLRISEQLRYDVVVDEIKSLEEKAGELTEVEQLTLKAYTAYVAAFGADKSPIKQDLDQIAAAIGTGIITKEAEPIGKETNIFRIVEVVGLEHAQIEGAAQSVSFSDPLGYANLQKGLASDGRDAGVVFRTSKPVGLSFVLDTKGLEISYAEAAKKKTCQVLGTSVRTESITVLAQHPFQTFVAETNRGALIKKRIDLTVTDGVLTGTEVDKPSEILAGVSLPVEILKTLVSIPAELLSVKLKLLEDQGSLTTAQADLIKAQIDLLRQQEEFRKLQQEQRNPPTDGS